MIKIANKNLFDNRAENYSKGRFGYAQAVVDLLCNEILKPNDKIADIGSGTGIFAEEFIKRGYDVYCVEPNDNMRAQAEKIFADNPHFISVAATAEHTTLSANSIDVVTAASAFHWFDADKFEKECKRILKPDRILFTVINSRDYNDPFTVAQHDLCKKLCPDFTSLRHGLEQSVPQFEKLFGQNLKCAQFDFPLEYTKERFLQRSLSSSYAPMPDTEEYQKYIQELRALMELYAPNNDKIVVPNSSVAYWGKLS